VLDEVDDPTHGQPQSNPLPDFSGFDPVRLAQDRALAWGQNAFNTSAETWLSGLADHGRARLNFRFDRDGHFQGEGDVFFPLYDTPRMLVFTQIGARNMDVTDGKDRWIGNFGLGQRWFPNATEDDSGNWMFGYNAFLDRDFTRSHNRGGVGIELQYDWLRFSSNAYIPLSGWKGSHDFDRRPDEKRSLCADGRGERAYDFNCRIEERPARGWDAHVKAFLPFDRRFAITGGFTQWVGDYVDMFGHGQLKKDSKDPKVWNYGLTYTPFPLISGHVTQRHTEGGRKDTEFGLNLTYRFGVPLSQQINPKFQPIFFF
jgi:hypothetical protein